MKSSNGGGVFVEERPKIEENRCKTGHELKSALVNFEQTFKSH